MSNFRFLTFSVRYFDIFKIIVIDIFIINDGDRDECIDQLKKANYYSKFQEILASKYNANNQVQEQEHWVRQNVKISVNNFRHLVKCLEFLGI